MLTEKSGVDWVPPPELLLVLSPIQPVKHTVKHATVTTVTNLGESMSPTPPSQGDLLLLARQTYATWSMSHALEGMKTCQR